MIPKKLVPEPGILAPLDSGIMFETEQSGLTETELRALRKKLTASKCRITRMSNNLENLLSDSEFKSIAVRDD